ncbi:dehydrodolichyl diphosphate synthase 6-like isoform X1 [Coffea eugenioides]|uniref:dehydrodolichyl diphosphate synthase 6-like isoform X1 n=1 Tax=Coffea eugenioides TaxID=49369 RepID=UPI000F60AE2D|nr:dehydrodolichyl diphosphate synthase 6-like isoform X1 [Coffea eugenioides]XP_027178389.1 dehydrodolichyl diphosphate synthase 6-like isoform X1 [Coffea eugenioides]
MEPQKHSLVGRLCGSSISHMRRFLFDVLSAGPIPNHVAFILDGNRRYARKWKLGEGMGHRAGFLSLMSLIKYCYELQIKYISIYAFSIDNFKRKPHEVKCLMDLMLEKIEGMLKEKTIVEEYGVRVYFIGDLKLLDDNVRHAAEQAMKATAKNSRSILLICVAYTSTDEIVHAAQESCEQLCDELQALKPSEAPFGKISDELQALKPSGAPFGKISEELHEMVHAAQESSEQLGNELQALKPSGAPFGKINEIAKEKLSGTPFGKINEIAREKLSGAPFGKISEIMNGKEEEKPEEREQGEANGEKREDKSEEKSKEPSEEEKHEELGKEKQGDFPNGEKLENASEEKQELSNGKLEEKSEEEQKGFVKEMKEVQPNIKLSDIERNMYMGVAPDVDILVRSSGETRLSNFLLWQTWNGLLYSPKALWPEVGLEHLVWAILNFQRAHPLFEKRKKQF